MVRLPVTEVKHAKMKPEFLTSPFASLLLLISFDLIFSIGDAGYLMYRESGTVPVAGL